MKAYHNDPKIKAFYLDRVRAHREADEIIHGTYWTNDKGCAVGCTIHSGRHADYETELGIPRVLARIEDGIFEGLPNGKSKLWPEQFLESVPVGSDLAPVFGRFMEWLLIDPADGVIRFAKTQRSKQSIQRVGDLFKQKNAGAIISTTDWRSAAAAAYAPYAAADAYAYAAAAAYAPYAAADAYTAAAYAAYAYAADAPYADYTAADDAARGKARIRQSEKLVELLKECI